MKAPTERLVRVPGARLDILEALEILTAEGKAAEAQSLAVRLRSAHLAENSREVREAIEAEANRLLAEIAGVRA